MKPPFYCPLEVVGIPGVKVKKTYNSFKEAKANGRDLCYKAYRCKTCGKIHLATKKKAAKGENTR